MDIKLDKNAIVLILIVGAAITLGGPLLGAFAVSHSINNASNAYRGWYYLNEAIRWYRAAGSTGLAGFKKFEHPSPDVFKQWLEVYNIPPLAFTLHASTPNPKTGEACVGLLKRVNSFSYLGSLSSTIMLDPRAGFCLGLLMQLGSIDVLEHLGAGTPGYTRGKDPAHEYGYAVDIVNDFDMNSIVTAATNLDMPLAWISKTGVTMNGKKSWPIYQLRNRKKIRIGWSSQNHDSHFHVILPRPNWALGMVQFR